MSNADFTTTARLELVVPDAELRDARSEIEQAVGDMDVSMNATGRGSATRAVTDGGSTSGLSPSRARRLRREEITLARQRTDQLGDIVTILEDGDFGGGGGGGGGAGSGFLPGVLGGAATTGSGGVLGRLGLAGLLSGTPFGATIAAGAGSGLVLREIFQNASFDESQLETPAGQFDRGLSQRIAAATTADQNDVAEAIRTEGLTLQNVSDIGPEVAEAIASETAASDAEAVADDLRDAFEGVNVNNLNISQPDTITITGRRTATGAPFDGEGGGGSSNNADVGLTQAEIIRRLGGTPEEVEEITRDDGPRTENGEPSIPNVTIDNTIDVDGLTRQQIEKKLDESVERIKRDLRRDLPRGGRP